DRAQIRSLFPNGRVHASPQLFFQSPQLGLPPLAHRLSQYREIPLPGFPATVRKSQKVKCSRFAVPAVSSVLFRKAAKPRKALAQFRQKPLCFMAMLKARNEVIGKTDEDNFSVRLLLSPSLDPEVENIVEIDVREQRTNATALNRSYLTLYSPA